ncbi:helix-turn-helix domain-containing protein [Kitasatospora purpeofusca]|uniref:helix-turn-helix domain-containing protein n=1 Tax=Kitasatospora purpeofusca TaxID=67352 RepID=UPI003657F55C
MSRDWARLGRLLRAGREAAGRTQDDLGTEIGVTRNAIAAIEAGAAKRITPTIRSYARAVGWSDTAVDAVLAGDDPFVAEGSAAPSAAAETAARAIADALLARLPQRVLQELADGHVIDTDLLDLRPDGSVALMALVLERGTDLPSPDRVREDLREWSQVQRRLRGVVQEHGDTAERSPE